MCKHMVCVEKYCEKCYLEDGKMKQLRQIMMALATREYHQTKGLMSRTMAVHVGTKYLHNLFSVLCTATERMTVAFLFLHFHLELKTGIKYFN